MFNRLIRNALFCIFAYSSAHAADLTITTGSSKGTYYRFGADIKLLAENAGLSVDVVESRGSVENLRRLLGYEGASEGQYYQLGLVQADVLQELREKAAGNETLEDIVSKIQVILPLYGEEIHVYVRDSSPFLDFEDFLRRADVISGGKEGSGTLHTTNTLVRLMTSTDTAISVDPVGGDVALEAVISGDTDGFVDVAGAPSTLGRSVTTEDGLRLLSIDARSLIDLRDSPFQSARLTRDAYPWMKESVNTMAVTSLLVAYAYDENNENCERIERLTRLIVNGLEVLKERGHRKWEGVSLQAARQRSDLYSCAKRVLYDE